MIDILQLSSLMMKFFALTQPQLGVTVGHIRTSGIGFNMAAVEDQYFYEDEVYRIDKRGHIEFGMVLENSELVSSDENSDGEEGAGMKKGQIRVAWHPSGVEEVISEKKVILHCFPSKSYPNISTYSLSYFSW